MLSLSAKIRSKEKEKNDELRKQELIPAVLYGPGIKNQSLSVKAKEFERVFQEAGESTMIKIEIKGNGEAAALIREVIIHPLDEKIAHIDFYQPNLKQEVEATVILVFKGESPAVKVLGGSLVKSFDEIEVKALPLELPHDIKVDLDKLKTFQDNILIKDLELPSGVKSLRGPDEVVATVVPPEQERIEEAPAEEAAEAVAVEGAVASKEGKFRSEDSGQESGIKRTGESKPVRNVRK